MEENSGTESDTDGTIKATEKDRDCYHKEEKLISTEMMTKSYIPYLYPISGADYQEMIEEDDEIRMVGEMYGIPRHRLGSLRQLWVINRNEDWRKFNAIVACNRNDSKREEGNVKAKVISTKCNNKKEMKEKNSNLKGKSDKIKNNAEKSNKNYETDIKLKYKEKGNLKADKKCVRRKDDKEDEIRKSLKDVAEPKMILREDFRDDVERLTKHPEKEIKIVAVDKSKFGADEEKVIEIPAAKGKDEEKSREEVASLWPGCSKMVVESEEDDMPEMPRKKRLPSLDSPNGDDKRCKDSENSEMKRSGERSGSESSSKVISGCGEDGKTSSRESSNRDRSRSESSSKIVKSERNGEHLDLHKSGKHKHRKEATIVRKRAQKECPTTAESDEKEKKRKITDDIGYYIGSQLKHMPKIPKKTSIKTECKSGVDGNSHNNSRSNRFWVVNEASDGRVSRNERYHSERNRKDQKDQRSEPRKTTDKWEIPVVPSDIRFTFKKMMKNSCFRFLQFGECRVKSCRFTNETPNMFENAAHLSNEQVLKVLQALRNNFPSLCVDSFAEMTKCLAGRSLREEFPKIAEDLIVECRKNGYLSFILRKKWSHLINAYLRCNVSNEEMLRELLETYAKMSANFKEVSSFMNYGEDWAPPVFKKAWESVKRTIDDDIDHLIRAMVAKLAALAEAEAEEKVKKEVEEQKKEAAEREKAAEREIKREQERKAEEEEEEKEQRKSRGERTRADDEKDRKSDTSEVVLDEIPSPVYSPDDVDCVETSIDMGTPPPDETDEQRKETYSPSCALETFSPVGSFQISNGRSTEPVATFDAIQDITVPNTRTSFLKDSSALWKTISSAALGILADDVDTDVEKVKDEAKAEEVRQEDTITRENLRDLVDLEPKVIEREPFSGEISLKEEREDEELVNLKGMLVETTPFWKCALKKGRETPPPPWLRDDWETSQSVFSGSPPLKRNRDDGAAVGGDVRGRERRVASPDRAERADPFSPMDDCQQHWLERNANYNGVSNTDCFSDLEIWEHNQPSRRPAGARNDLEPFNQRQICVKNDANLSWNDSRYSRCSLRSPKRDSTPNRNTLRSPRKDSNAFFVNRDVKPFMRRLESGRSDLESFREDDLYRRDLERTRSNLEPSDRIDFESHRNSTRERIFNRNDTLDSPFGKMEIATNNLGPSDRRWDCPFTRENATWEPSLGNEMTRKTEPCGNRSEFVRNASELPSLLDVTLEPPSSLSKNLDPPPSLFSKKMEPQPLFSKKVEPPPLFSKKVEPPPLFSKKMESASLFSKQLEPQPLFSKKMEPPPLFGKKMEPPPLFGKPLELPPLFGKPLEPQPLFSKKMEPPALFSKKLEPQPLFGEQLKPQPLFSKKMEPPSLFSNKPSFTGSYGNPARNMEPFRISSPQSNRRKSDQPDKKRNISLNTTADVSINTDSLPSLKSFEEIPWRLEMNRPEMAKKFEISWNNPEPSRPLANNNESSNSSTRRFTNNSETLKTFTRDAEHSRPFADNKELPKPFMDNREPSSGFSDKKEFPKSFMDNREPSKPSMDKKESLRPFMEYVEPSGSFVDKKETPRPFLEHVESSRPFMDEKESPRSFADNMKPQNSSGCFLSDCLPSNSLPFDRPKSWNAKMERIEAQNTNVPKLPPWVTQDFPKPAPPPPSDHLHTLVYRLLQDRCTDGINKMMRNCPEPQEPGIIKAILRYFADNAKRELEFYKLMIKKRDIGARMTQLFSTLGLNLLSTLLERELYDEATIVANANVKYQLVYMKTFIFPGNTDKDVLSKLMSVCGFLMTTYNSIGIFRHIYQILTDYDLLRDPELLKITKSDRSFAFLKEFLKKFLNLLMKTGECQLTYDLLLQLPPDSQFARMFTPEMRDTIQYLLEGGCDTLSLQLYQKFKPLLIAN